MPPNVRLSFGPMLLGVFFNMILYGILIMQTLTYFTTFKSDSRWMKLFIGYLFIIATANTGFDMFIVYQPLILEYGEVPTFFPKLFVTQPLSLICISVPIQFFFAWRIKRITKSPWIPGFICVLAAASFAGGLWTAIRLSQIKLFRRKPELHDSALVWFLTACVADLLITVTLVHSLSHRKTGFVATDGVIDRIIRLTVQTGMITAIFAVGDVIFFMTLERTALNFIWDLTLTKLYVNCLMSTLNARTSLNNMSGMSSGNRNVNLQEISGGSRRPMDQSFMDVGGQISTYGQTYELDQTNSYSTKELDHAYSPGGRHQEPDFGITVTKVVERLV